jgi:hypothetical protein
VPISPSKPIHTVEVFASKHQFNVASPPTLKRTIERTGLSAIIPESPSHLQIRNILVVYKTSSAIESSDFDLTILLGSGKASL